MALSSPSTTAPAGAMGDTLSGLVAGEAEIAGARFVLRNHGKSWNAHNLHDCAAHPFLVRPFDFGERVSHSLLIKS